MDLGLRGLRVMVSAGAGGIGLAIARTFVREGARVSVCDVDVAALEKLAHSEPALHAARCDVSNREEVASWFDAALAHLGGLDCMVNNAGIAGPTGKIDVIAPDEWDRCIAICLTGQFNCLRLAVSALRASSNASIVNVSSLAGRLGFALRTPYAAAKWGVIGLTRSLSIELGPDNIRVNAISAGPIKTLAAMGIKDFSSIRDVYSQRTPLRRNVELGEVADTAAFLFSPAARGITGEIVMVDAGYHVTGM
jgi:NAD(P)-dependent dehydrogenase (short-subunit alcohol dehydrogenase family)